MFFAVFILDDLRLQPFVMWLLGKFILHEKLPDFFLQSRFCKCAKQHWPIVLFVVIFLICVAADGDDADSRAGCVGDDDRLSGDVVLVLMVSSGAGSLLCFTSPPPSTPTPLRGRTVRGRAIL